MPTPRQWAVKCREPTSTLVPKTTRWTVQLHRAARWVLVAGFWVGMWALLAHWVGSNLLLVGPVGTLVRLWELLHETTFYTSVLQTVANIVAGFALSLVIGVVLAFCAYFLPLIATLLNPLVRFIRVVPVASITITILVFMSSRYLPIVVSFLMVFPLVYMNAWTGIENTSADLQEMSRVFRVPLRKQVRHMYLPATMPYVVSAYVTGFGFAWKSAVTAEVISSATASVGAHLSDAKVYLDSPSLFAWTFVIVILASATEHIAIWLIPKHYRVQATATGGM